MEHDKTVFISYRRSASTAWALAVFQDLTKNGYDVFFDYVGISSGDFERVIVENIDSRAHFLILLTPATLQRSNEPGDWVRREIERAINKGRNIVPLFLEGFDFDQAKKAKQLRSILPDLSRYQGLHVYADYFQAAMERLREIYLSTAAATTLPTPSQAALEATESQQKAARDAAPVKAEELTALESAEHWLKEPVRVPRKKLGVVMFLIVGGMLVFLYLFRDYIAVRVPVSVQIPTYIPKYEAPEYDVYEVQGISSPGRSFQFTVPKSDGYYSFTTKVIDSSGRPQSVFIALYRQGAIVKFHYFITQPFHAWPARDDSAQVVLKADGTLAGTLHVDLGDGNKELSIYNLMGKLKGDSAR